jgi:hypothetical protein
LNVPLQRLSTQRLTHAPFATPAEVVAWFGAVQAQDYRGGLWGVGLRMRRAVESDVEQALAARAIVRTWPLRGTLHFVAPADVHWMLKHFGPRTVGRAAPRFKQLELDARVFTRSARLLVKALEGGRQLTRDAMYARLESARVSTADGRGLHILWRLAHDGVLCFGARQGRQHTFALLDEWTPAVKGLERDEALAELARRYFTSHGPATLQDFVWWSGLNVADARAGLDLAKPHLVNETIGPHVYWLQASKPARGRSSSAHLLPLYDEYTVGYRDRSAILPGKYVSRAGNGIFKSPVIVDGLIVATWTRTIKRGELAVNTSPFAKLAAKQASAIADATKRFLTFAREISTR